MGNNDANRNGCRGYDRHLPLLTTRGQASAWPLFLCPLAVNGSGRCARLASLARTKGEQIVNKQGTKREHLKCQVNKREQNVNITLTICNVSFIFC